MLASSFSFSLIEWIMVERHHIAILFFLLYSLSFTFYFYSDVNRPKLCCVCLILVAATHGARHAFFTFNNSAQHVEEKKKKEEKKEHTAQEQYCCSVYLQDSERVSNVKDHFFYKERQRSNYQMSFRRSSTRVKPPKATIKILCVGDGSIGEYLKSHVFLPSFSKTYTFIFILNIFSMQEKLVY